MGIIIRALAVLALAGMTAGSVQAQTIRVMVLGVAHLEAKHDIHNSVFTDSPLSPKRQAQIAAVVARLARFHPTKVLIEEPFGGFRLAARAGDPTIYPIDTFEPSLIDENSPSGKRIMAYLTAHFMDVADPTSDAFIARDDKIERDGTYMDLLRYLNSDAAIRANASWYSLMDGMGRAADDAGAAYVAQWYSRNCYIFSNIRSVVRPGDRVLVMMGQGHEYLLREFVRLSPDMTYVNPLDYL